MEVQVDFSFLFSPPPPLLIPFLTFILPREYLKCLSISRFEKFSTHFNLNFFKLLNEWQIFHTSLEHLYSLHPPALDNNHVVSQYLQIQQ